MDDKKVVELVPRGMKALPQFKQIPQYTIDDSVISRSIAFQIARAQQIALLNYRLDDAIHGDVFDLLHELSQMLDKAELPVFNLNAVTVKTAYIDSSNVIVYLNVTPRSRINGMSDDHDSIGEISSLQLQVELVTGKTQPKRAGQVLAWTKVDVDTRSDSALQAMHYRQIIDNISNMLYVAGGYSDIVDGMYVGYMPYSDTRSICVTMKGDLPFLGTDWETIKK